MAGPERPLVETRYAQMFPTLSPDEIGRLRHFGEVRRYAAGEQLVTTGEPSPGMLVVLSGDLAVSQHNVLGRSEPIVTHGPGGFMGELAQLSGRPALVDAVAVKPVEILVIPSRSLRDVLVAEAELGERIMRALILRRVGLLQTGHSGPVIIGHAGSSDVLRLAEFLRRSGHPHHALDPDLDSCAKTLLDRFEVAASQLPIVLCPNGSLLRNPGEGELARCLGLVRPIDPAKIYDVAIVGAGPAGLAAAVYAASEGLSVIGLDCRAFGGQAGASARIENYLGFPTGITGMALMARAFNQAQKFGAELAIPDEVVRLNRQPGPGPGRFQLGLANGETVVARAVVIASGAKYLRLNVANLAEFEGACVHYWASPLEGKLCAGQEVALVGAGNSAGQAVVYLASQVAKVRVLVRRPGLGATMSSIWSSASLRFRTSRCSRKRKSAPSKGRLACWKRSAGATSRRARRCGGPFVICFCSSARSRIRPGSRHPTSPSTTRASCAPARSCNAVAGLWKRAWRASSRSATRGRDRSSESLQQSVRARR